MVNDRKSSRGLRFVGRRKIDGVSHVEPHGGACESGVFHSGRECFIRLVDPFERSRLLFLREACAAQKEGGDDAGDPKANHAYSFSVSVDFGTSS